MTSAVEKGLSRLSISTPTPISIAMPFSDLTGLPDTAIALVASSMDNNDQLRVMETDRAALRSFRGTVKEVVLHDQTSKASRAVVVSLLADRPEVKRLSTRGINPSLSPDHMKCAVYGVAEAMMSGHCHKLQALEVYCERFEGFKLLCSALATSQCCPNLTELKLTIDIRDELLVMLSLGLALRSRMDHGGKGLKVLSVNFASSSLPRHPYEMLGLNMGCGFTASPNISPILRSGACEFLEVLVINCAVNGLDDWLKHNNAPCLRKLVLGSLDNWTALGLKDSKIGPNLEVLEVTGPVGSSVPRLMQGRERAEVNFHHVLPRFGDSESLMLGRVAPYGKFVL